MELLYGLHFLMSGFNKTQYCPFLLPCRFVGDFGAVVIINFVDVMYRDSVESMGYWPIWQQGPQGKSLFKEI